MSPAVTIVNRVLLVALGLLLAAAGGLGLALSFGAFGAARRDQPVLDEQVTDFADRTGWFWWAVAAGCVLIGLLALWWLLAQTRTQRVGRLDVTDDELDGVTLVHTGAVSDAVESEVETCRGVQRASARFHGKRAPRLDVTVDLDETADLAQIRQRLGEQTVPRARQAVGDPDLVVQVELRLVVGKRPALH